jgi:hypothetical protein
MSCDDYSEDLEMLQYLSLQPKRKSKSFTNCPILITCVSALLWQSGTEFKTCSNGIEIRLLKEDILTL